MVEHVLVLSVIESNLASETVGVYADTADGLSQAMSGLAVVLANSGFAGDRATGYPRQRL